VVSDNLCSNISVNFLHDILVYFAKIRSINTLERQCTFHAPRNSNKNN
jgi:hypothetical protein